MPEILIYSPAAAPKVPVKYDGGLHYQGVVAGHPETLVAISVFNDMVMGIIVTKKGTYNLGKVEGQNKKHILFLNADLKKNEQLNCGTLDDGISYKPSQLAKSQSSVGISCAVRVYVEVDKSVYDGFSGNLTNTTNFVTGLFNQSFVLYTNEEIDMVISELVIWTTPDPYPGGSSSSFLSQFKANTGAFNGDIGHLIALDNVGGVAAGFAGLCNPNTDLSLCFSGLSGLGYDIVPNFSFNVYLLTHEMGHLLGSRHTHACVWNGNSTAIDGCSGFTEGGCALPPSPAGGGTIMSYCNSDFVGINFNLGFGPQPGNVIRNNVNNATCLTNCCVAPIITCPANVIVNNTPGLCGANVTYPAATATGDPAPTITYSIASGSFFALGTTTVTAIATNNCATRICTFTVTVKDAQSPTITCPANSTTSNAANLCNAVVTYPFPTVSDNCPNQYTLNTSSGSIVTFHGITFDVTNNSTFPLTISGFTAPIGSGIHPVAVYYTTTASTAVGNEQNAANWTLLGTTTVNSSSNLSLIEIPVGGLALAAGQSKGIYIAVTDGSTFGYATGNSTGTNGVLTITNNNHRGGQYPFINNNVPRRFIGSVSYTQPIVITQTTGLPSGSVFPVGTTTNTFTATDFAGNTGSCSFTVTVTDNQAPTITCPENIAVNNTPGTCGATVNYTVGSTDNCPGQMVTQTAGFASGEVFPVGVTTNVFLVTDAAGNTATCSFTVTVTDNQLPTITCPANIAVNNTTGTCGAMVNYIVGSSDNCPGQIVTQTGGLASGAVFPVGITTNTFIVTDAAGLTANCSFTVTVTDSELPAITCPSNISVNNTAGICGATVNYIVGSSDNCPGQTVSQTAGLASGAVFPLGVTTNTFRVTDASGNTATCSFTVTVTDNQLPTITYPSNVTVNNTSGQCGAKVCYPSPVVTDNCKPATPAGYTLVANFGNSYYYRSNSSTNYTTAQNNALSAGGHLAVITSLAERNAIVAGGGHGWLGGNDLTTEGIFKWATCEPFTYSLWCGGEPNGGTSENHLELEPPSFGGCFNDLSAGSLRFSILEIEGAKIVQTAGLPQNAFFPIGTTINTFVATDAAGNSATCSFTVTVVDNQPPVLTTAANSNINLNSSCLVLIPDVRGTATDNCPGVTITQIPVVGAIVPSSHNGIINVVVTATDANGLTDVETVVLTAKDVTAPVITTCAANKVAATDAGLCTKTFTAAQIGLTAATDNCTATVTWSRSDGSLNLTDPFAFGITTITWTATDGAGLTAACSQTIDINIVTATTTVTVTPNMQQYSDKVTFVATVTPNNCAGAGGIGGTVTFKIGSLVMGTAPVLSDGTATLANVALVEPTLNGSNPTNGPLKPGAKTVTAVYNATDADYTVTNPTASLTINCEDARAYYTGALYTSTTSATSSSATITLSATVRDITAELGNPAYDANAGDIRNATVTFINRDNNTVIATVPVGLANPGDFTTGTATYNYPVTISGDAQQFTIGIIVNNYYCRNSSDDNTVVTVAKPLGELFITGGGYLVLTSSAGIKAGTAGTKNNFGFNVKYNKARTNLQGSINTIVRKMEAGVMRVYQVKGNAMTSLAVNENCPKTATFNGKANITDITNPLAPVSVAGNALLQVTMTDM